MRMIECAIQQECLQNAASAGVAMRKCIQAYQTNSNINSSDESMNCLGLQRLDADIGRLT